jgi:hypothetical protein
VCRKRRRAAWLVAMFFFTGIVASKVRLAWTPPAAV